MTTIAPVPARQTDLMTAVVLRCYGGPEVLTLAHVAIPAPSRDQVLVRVHASSINPLDVALAAAFWARS
ncbi:MAG: hypothetical protein ACREOK_12515 [Gemmatimonadaceae bacterium]